MIRSYTNDELIKLMDAAPLPVQQAIESKTTAAFISGIGTKLNLHIEQIAKLAELNVQRLLGLVNPEEFLEELIVTGISDKDAREIVAEINQKIFVPLHKEEQGGGMSVSQSMRPITSSKYFDFAANTEAVKKIREDAKKSSDDKSLDALREALKKADGGH